MVVGSGIAGLTAALELRTRVPHVLLVTKGELSSGSTVWAQGGIAAALDPEDSPEAHLADTLVAGAGVCDPAAVEVLVTEGPARVRELVARGANFDRAANGDIALTREGGHHADRIAHAGGDATGAEISRALVAQLEAVRRDPGIEVIENALVLDVLTTDGSGDRAARACGVTLHVRGEGSRDGVGAVLARAVVLATGGVGQVFRSSTNPPQATGDGIAAALRAGATLGDLEFVQFHPTVLWLGLGAKGQARSSPRPCAARARSSSTPTATGSCPRSTPWPSSRRATSWRTRSCGRWPRPARTTCCSTPGTSVPSSCARASRRSPSGSPRTGSTGPRSLSPWRPPSTTTRAAS